MLDGEWRRGAFAEGRVRRRSIRRSCPPRCGRRSCQEFPCAAASRPPAPPAQLSTRRGPRCRACAPSESCCRCWSSTMVAPQSIVVLSPAKRPNRLPSSAMSSRHRYCTMVCCGIGNPSRVRLLARTISGMIDIGVERNVELGAIVVEKAVGAAARGRDGIHGVEDVQRRALEHRRRLYQRLAVGLFENAALDEAVYHQLPIARRIGRIGDLLGTQHGKGVVPECHRAWRQQIERLDSEHLHARNGVGQRPPVARPFAAACLRSA